MKKNEGMRKCRQKGIKKENQGCTKNNQRRYVNETKKEKGTKIKYKRKKTIF